MTDGHLTLTISGVGQHMMTIHITNGIDPGDIGATMGIGGDSGAISGNANILQTQTHMVGPATNAQKHLIGGHSNLLPLRCFGHNLTFADRQTLVTQQEGHALLLHLLLEHGADFPVSGSGNVVKHLNDAATNDHKLPGNLLQIQNLPVGQHKLTQIFLYAGNRWNSRRRTGGNQDTFTGVSLLPGSYLKTVLITPGNHRLSHDHRHTRRLHLGFDTGNQCPDDLILSGYHCLLVDGNISTGYAISLGMKRMVIGFG